MHQGLFRIGEDLQEMLWIFEIYLVFQQIDLNLYGS